MKLEFTKIEIPENGTLICLYSTNLNIGAAVVVNSSWGVEDKNALKELITGFKNQNVGLSTQMISAKIVGPRDCISVVGNLFSSHGIKVVTSHELSGEESSAAFFYSDSGRLRLGKEAP